MMSAVEEVIENVILSLGAQHRLNLPLLKRSTELEEELGFTPWTVLELLARLAEVLGIDPLEDEDVAITQIRTFGDVCNICERGLARVECIQQLREPCQM